jgi:primase-polymerase (primpol)-like protein
MGKCTVKLSEINDDWQDWMSLQGAEKGKLKVRIEKLYPKSEDKLKQKQVKSDCSCKKLVQFYLGELKGKKYYERTT